MGTPIDTNMNNTGMYQNPIDIKNTYSFDQNKQTDSILNKKIAVSHFKENTKPAMNNWNWQGSLMTGGMCAAGGGVVASIFTSSKGFTGKAGAVAIGAAIGFAAPTILSSVKKIFN